ncbi:head-tail connector protein [Shimia thalassica]|uniref:head-tail connector protein n=1 Tax=Shimia thalassica TaxID=1715693 RepID=UPI002090BDB3|nr:head-tail connector protein [Shimia thalassica]MDO6505007.1 head-tail connector protein [Shimia thalassica]MDO6523262.1 head-tail connector protein [Shimia thalassica]
MTLAEVKPHLAVEHDEHDDLIQGYIDQAEAHVGAYLRRDMAADFPDGWPEGVKGAVRLMVASFFHYREAGAESGGDGVPTMAREMLAPYRCFV